MMAQTYQVLDGDDTARNCLGIIERNAALAMRTGGGHLLKCYHDAAVATVTQSEIETMHSLFRNGKSIREISKITGRSISAVRAKTEPLRPAKPKTTRIPKDELQQIFALLSAGAKKSEIAAKFAYSIDTIRTVSKTMGLYKNEKLR